MKRLLLLSAIVATTLAFGACKDDAILVTPAPAPTEFTISGTLTWASWLTGNYVAVAFPQGTNPGPTGSLGDQTVTGTSTSANYTVSIPPNAGDVYIFAWNDADGSTDPTTGEGGGCSSALTLGGSVTGLVGIDIIFTTNGFCLTSP